MEWIFYTAIVMAIDIVVTMIAWHFCMYIREHDGLRSWRNARFEAWLHEAATPQIRLSTADRVLIAAKNVRCDCQRDSITGVVHVVLSGDFDEYDMRNML